MAGRNGNGEPRSASSARQDSIMHPRPAITAISEPATAYQDRFCSAAATAARSAYSA
jgi:hypothetical protein